MKKIFLVLGVAAGTFAVKAQEVRNYDVSVFDNSQLLDIANKQTTKATMQKAGVAFPGFVVATDKLSGMAKDIFGKTMAVPGNTNTEKATNVISNKLSTLGVNGNDWQKAGETSSPNASYVNYEQSINGHKVAFSRLSFRFTLSGDLQRIIMDNYGQPQANATARMDSKAILSSPALTTDLVMIDVSAQTIENDWVWFPVPTNNGYELKAAWPFTVAGTDRGRGLPVEFYGYIDAETGIALYRKNDVKENLDLVIKGTVYKDDMTLPTTDEVLPNIFVKVGSTSLTADANGLVSSTTFSVPQSLTLSLEGKWSIVSSMTSSSPVVYTTATYPYSLVKTPDTILFDGTTRSAIGQVNAYYHVNRVHDYVKSMLPGLTQIDFKLPTRVDVVSTQYPNGCNAFYSSNTINFLKENASCNDFAKIGDIVYHEYGHYVSDKFYNAASVGRMDNGGLNEGCSDVWAMSITHNPILGKGAFKNGSNIRSYNGTPKVYPMDNTSEVHANGEIIAGAWWDVGINLGSADSMSKLFAKTYYDTPDGPEGTEGDVFHQVLVSALINDDNDGDLSNGTPHFNQITAGFARHGIYLFGVATLDHKEVAHQQAGQATPITANLTSTTAQKDGPAFASLKLIYRNRKIGTWDSLVMNNLGAGATGGIDFSAQIPAQDGGSLVDYYFVSYDINGNAAFSFPEGFNTLTSSNQVSIPYQFGVGVNSTSYAFDFETAASEWTIGGAPGDNATAGLWIQAVPVAAYWKPSSLSFMSQTDKDHTTGSGKCLVTGNGANTGSEYNTADVDNGKTSVISPRLDLTGMVYPIIEYYRWYSNDRGPRDSNPRTDMFQAQVRDEKATVWKTVDATFQSDHSWRRRIFALADYWPTSKYVYLRFIASDDVLSNVTNSAQGNVEAAIDDIFVYDIFPTSVANKPAPVKMDVYPNPANNTVTITLAEATQGTLSIADLTGRAIVSQIMDAKSLTYTVNTSSLATGTYMLMIKTSNSIQTRKIAVAH